MRDYIKILIVFVFLSLSMYSCKAQNIPREEKVLYTLENYEHCLFYDEQTSNIEGIDLRRLDCSINYKKRYFTKESKELLFEVIKKRYSDEYLKEASKKRVLLNFKSQLGWYSEKLKDSSNFIYSNKFNKRGYKAYKGRKKELEKLLSSRELDTISKYKKQIDDLYNYLQKYKISNSLIYAVAFVEHKDKAIPFLKGLFKDTIHINASAIKLSLAKLKVEPYYTNQLTKLKKDVNHIISNIGGDNDENSKINRRFAYPRAGLILTKEAISIYAKVLEAKYFDTIDHGDVSESSIPVRTLMNLVKLINNEAFIAHFHNEYNHIKGIHEFTKEDIKWAIEWFKLNKGKLEINEEHIPSLHNKL